MASIKITLLFSLLSLLPPDPSAEGRLNSSRSRPISSLRSPRRNPEKRPCSVEHHLGAHRPRDQLWRGVRPLQSRCPRNRLRRGRHTAPQVGLRPHSATIFSLLPTPTARPSRSLSSAWFCSSLRPALALKMSLRTQSACSCMLQPYSALSSSITLSMRATPHSPTTGSAVAAVRHLRRRRAPPGIPSPWSSFLLCEAVRPNLNVIRWYGLSLVFPSCCAKPCAQTLTYCS
jgi:hypothetical protein